LLGTATLTENLQARLPGRQFEFVPEAETPVVLVSGLNPFGQAAHLAWSSHYPLMLSPDCLWLLIAQGFAHHVAENSAKLRPVLVRHEGRKELAEAFADLSPASFQAAIERFSAQVRGEIDPVLHETLLCDFSTTVPAARTASEIALMDTFSSYFDYLGYAICGIPRIRLTGTVEDWRRIRARVEVLSSYGLEWWVSHLRPILDEFVLAAEGQPHREFWRNMYMMRKHKTISTGGCLGRETPVVLERVTGWVTALFPWLGDDKRFRNNLDSEESPGNDAILGLSFEAFPGGVSKVPLEVSKQKFDLIGGFLSVRQDPRDLIVSPLIGWCVATSSRRFT
jgi:hypothetical protein